MKAEYPKRTRKGLVREIKRDTSRQYNGREIIIGMWRGFMEAGGYDRQRKLKFPKNIINKAMQEYYHIKKYLIKEEEEDIRDQLIKGGLETKTE